MTAGGDLTLQAGNDVNARAAAMAAEGDVGIQAGRDVNLLAEATTTRSSSQGGKKTVIDESVRQQGTAIASGGNTVILAGRDVTAQAAEVTAQGDIGVAAGRDVNLTTATESDYHFKEETKTKKGFLSKKTTHTIEEDSATRKGSLLSGDNVTVSAGNNLRVSGSAVAGDGDVALSAGNNVDIVAATNTDTSGALRRPKVGSDGHGRYRLHHWQQQNYPRPAGAGHDAERELQHGRFDGRQRQHHGGQTGAYRRGGYHRAEGYPSYRRQRGD